MEERLVSPKPKEEDREIESSLRPTRLADYIGQERIKERLRIYIEAAKERGDPLDHVLLYGPPGLGKTTLAHIIANEMGSSIRTTSGPAIERPGDMVAILTNLDDRGVLFIDELHRLNRTAEEALYPAMEDFLYDWVAGKGPSARTYRVKLPRFTLIGATTRAGLLASPLRDRFGITLRLEFYEPADLERIASRSAGILGVTADEEGFKEIAARSRGTPRVANRLLRRLRDYAQVRGNGVIDGRTAEEGLRMLEVDHMGLDRVDREMLRSIIEKYGGGPVGLETIAASISEEPETIEDVYEPYLLQIGFIQRTPRGRVVTRGAYEHLGLKPPGDPSSQQRLW
ncbi:MAG: Holliday junction branch migration DNA helicase RuvB [Firmicutes bacterium]|nr:Holliday junction branch migration DNA helicase RuvB [Bacillota bacterium]